MATPKLPVMWSSGLVLWLCVDSCSRRCKVAVRKQVIECIQDAIEGRDTVKQSPHHGVGFAFNDIPCQQEHHSHHDTDKKLTDVEQVNVTQSQGDLSLIDSCGYYDDKSKRPN